MSQNLEWKPELIKRNADTESGNHKKFIVIFKSSEDLEDIIDIIKYTKSRELKIESFFNKCMEIDENSVNWNYSVLSKEQIQLNF